MIVTRFCSRAEYEAFMRGDDLVNNTDHFRGGKGGSTSVGFCFSPDKPKVAWRYLKGIVCPEICMSLEFPDNYLKESRGKYVDYSDDEVMNTCLKKEYCAIRYNNKTAKLIRLRMMNEMVSEEELNLIKYLYQLKQSNNETTQPTGRSV